MRRVAAIAAAAWLSGCAPPCEDGRICAVMGSGELGFNGDGLPALETRLALPTAVAVSPDGDVLVVDYSNMRVRSLDDDGNVVTVIGSGVHAYSEPGANVLDSPMENPIDAAFGPDGDLYVLPQHEGRVLRIIDDKVTVCAGTGQIADEGDGGPATEAHMGFGTGLSFASDGTMFVTDQSFSRVRRVSPDGIIDTVLGTGARGQGGPGYGPEVAIDYAERSVVDEENGRLLVADTHNHRILAVDLTTLDTTIVAGTGIEGYSGDGGPATEALLNFPTAVAVTPGGGVLIGDLLNDVLRHIDADGTITTVAGDPGELPRNVESPLRQRIRQPAGLTWTPEGDLYIAERGGQRVLRWMGAADAF